MHSRWLALPYEMDLYWYSDCSPGFILTNSTLAWKLFFLAVQGLGALLSSNLERRYINLRNEWMNEWISKYSPQAIIKYTECIHTVWQVFQILIYIQSYIKIVNHILAKFPTILCLTWQEMLTLSLVHIMSKAYLIRHTYY